MRKPQLPKNFSHLFPICCLSWKIKWKLQFPCTEMEGKHEHTFTTSWGWVLHQQWSFLSSWRRTSPVLSLPGHYHLSSEGLRTWHPTWKARIPQAIAANSPLLAGNTPDVQFCCRLMPGKLLTSLLSEWQTQATEDNYLGTGGFFPGRGLLLSCLSVAGGKGGFCILGKCSPRGLQSWEKGGVEKKLNCVSTAYTMYPRTDASRHLTFPLVPRAVRQEGRHVSVLALLRIKTR